MSPWQYKLAKYHTKQNVLTYRQRFCRLYVNENNSPIDIPSESRSYLQECIEKYRKHISKMPTNKLHIQGKILNTNQVHL